jgi:hypothetical protein
MSKQTSQSPFNGRRQSKTVAPMNNGQSSSTKKRRNRRRNRKPRLRKTNKSLVGNNSIGQKVDLQIAPVKDLSSNNTLATMNSLISNELTLQAQPPIEFCFSFVNWLYSKGYQKFVDNPSDPFFIYIYLAGVLSSFLKNTVPTTQQLPEFLAHILNYLRPKQVPKNGGSVAFNFFGDFDNSTFPPVINLGPSTSRQATLYIPDNTVYINGVWAIMVAASAYNLAAAELAWTKMLGFIGSISVEMHNPRMKIVDVSQTNMHEHDASAFAFGMSFHGSETGNAGGPGSVKMLEVPIHTPDLTCWVQQPFNSVSNDRFPSYSRAASGSAGALPIIYGSDRLGHAYGRQSYTRLGFCDFYEFVLRLAVYYQLLAQEAANDSQMSDKDMSYFQIPLTVQDFTLAVRALIMFVYGDSQMAYQYEYPSTNNNNPGYFIPIVAASGTGPIGSVGSTMMLPLDFIEMLNGMTAKTIAGKNGMSFAPVWGVFHNITPNVGSFTVSRGEDSIPLFLPAEAYKRNLKTQKHDGEVPISIIDGSSPAGYVVLNDELVIDTITLVLTTFLQKFAAFTGVVSTIYVDAGLRPLGTVANFRFIRQESMNVDNERVAHRDLVKQKYGAAINRTGKNGIVTSGPYDFLVVEATAYNSHPNNTVLQYLAANQMPVEMKVTSNPVDEKSTFKKMQTLHEAMFSVVGDAASDEVSISLLAQMAAARNVKSRNAQKTMADVQLESATLQGHGGIFTTLLKGALGLMKQEARVQLL